MSKRSTNIIGAIYALIAYTSWGLSPIFWKQLQGFPPEAMLGFRVFWSFLVLLLLGLIWRRFVFDQTKKLATRKGILLTLLATLCIAVNWYTYIWAISQNRIMEASLGYYLNPLGNILIGIFFFKEKLSRIKRIAFGLAILAVSLLIASYGQIPWASLILASSFTCYGMIKKMLPLSAAFSLGIETLLLMPLACFFIVQYYPDLNALQGLSSSAHIWFALSGLLTLIPLFAFAKAARLLPYSTLGFFQYIAPTLQLFCAVVLYQESFDRIRMLSFGLIWLSLIGLSFEQMRLLLRQKRPS